MATTMQQHQFKNSLKIASILEIVAGLWLIIAPFATSFSNNMAALWNSIILGVIITFLASARATEEGKEITWPSWASLVLGVWLLLSPFILSFTSGTAYWNTLIFGIVVVLLSIWSLLPASKNME